MNQRHAPRNFNASAWLLQAAVIGALAALAIYFGMTAWHRMHQQGIAYGFDILSHPTGWQISSPFLDQTPEDPYWWTLCVAFVNTLAASLASIVLASFLGFWLGIGLRARNRVVAKACSIYVEIFRNIPLVLQAVFWYMTFTQLPAPRDHPPALLHAIFVTNQGVFVPRLAIAHGYGLLLAAALAVAAFALPFHARLRRGAATWQCALRGAILAVVAVALYCAARGAPLRVALPQLSAFTFTGGFDVPLELIALIYATVIFSAAYIGEIVRGGLQSVPRGLVEAAQALGLPPHVVFMKVRFPIALRSMIPALGNLFLFIVKATAIGSAIGYSEIFSVSVVSISQTGQSVEFLLLMMLVYFILNYSLTQLMNALNRAIAFKGNRK